VCHDYSARRDRNSTNAVARGEIAEMSALSAPSTVERGPQPALLDAASKPRVRDEFERD